MELVENLELEKILKQVNLATSKEPQKPSQKQPKQKQSKQP